MVKEKVILALFRRTFGHIGGWLPGWNKDYDVIAVCMDVGEGNDFDFIHDKALRKLALLESHVIDKPRLDSRRDYVLVVRAHTFYEQNILTLSALSRPLISKKLS